MHITASAVSLNVDDVEASASFAMRHLGFEGEMAADGFASLARADAGFNLIFLRTGLETFKPDRSRSGFNLIFLRTGLETFKPDRLRGRHADGLLVVFVVDDVDGEHARLQEEGVAITTPIQTEPWGERFFQVTDPNGVVVQLVQWVPAPGAER